jgi:hypothetical protein
MKIILIAVVILVSCSCVYGDASPFYSSARIEIEYAIPDTASLLECCVIYLNSSGGYDTACKCGSVCVSAFDRNRIKMIRMIPEKFRLILKYNDRTVTTPELRKNGMNSYHKILIKGNNAEDITPVFKTKYSDYGIALLATLILELLIAGIFFLINKVPARYLFAVGFINLITHPLLWLTASNLTGFGTSLIWLEAIVTAVEAYFIFRILKGRMSLFKSFILSIVMNLTSFIIGGLIYLILY